jgi:hypothetical protein
VDLEVRQNEHQPLSDLTTMAYSVLLAVIARVQREGRLPELHAPGLFVPGDSGLEPRPAELVERPPLATLPAADRA